MQRWTIGVLAVLVGAACSRGESLGIEEAPERVLELQDLLETEGITTSNETRFLPNPHSSDIRAGRRRQRSRRMGNRPPAGPHEGELGQRGDRR